MQKHRRGASRLHWHCAWLTGAIETQHATRPAATRRTASGKVAECRPLLPLPALACILPQHIAVSLSVPPPPLLGRLCARAAYQRSRGRGPAPPPLDACRRRRCRPLPRCHPRSTAPSPGPAHHPARPVSAAPTHPPGPGRPGGMRGVAAGSAPRRDLVRHAPAAAAAGGVGSVASVPGGHSGRQAGRRNPLPQTSESRHCARDKGRGGEGACLSCPSPHAVPLARRRRAASCGAAHAARGPASPHPPSQLQPARDSRPTRRRHRPTQPPSPRVEAPGPAPSASARRPCASGARLLALARCSLADPRRAAASAGGGGMRARGRARGAIQVE